MPTKFNVGDKVKIVNVRNCKFDYNANMIKCIGQTTTIINEELTPDGMLRIYKIKADKGRFNWSANCLKLINCNFILKNE